MAVVTFERFYDGESYSSKIGYPYSYQDGLGLDTRSDPDKVGVLRKLEKESGTVVTDLVKAFKEYNGLIFGYGSTGKLYKRDTSKAWTNIRTVSNSIGQDLEIFNSLNEDALFYSSNSSLGRATTLTGTIVFDDDYISTSLLNRDLVVRNIPSAYSGTPYNLTTAINEGATHKQTFTASKYNCRGFQVYITAKGTSANWTLTLHNKSNSVISSVTVNNGSLTSSQFNSFYFATPISLVPGTEYHIHLTASNTTGTPQAGTGIAGDLEDLGFYLIWNSLENAQMHPLKEFTNLLCIGNGRYLATLDDSEVYNPERLIFSQGEEVRIVEIVGDYLAIFTSKYNDITKVGSSKMYLWDGISPTYNNIIPIADGQVNAVTTYGNILYMVNGTKGQISAWSGDVTPVRRIKDIEQNKYIEVLPNAMTVWNGLIHFGIGNGDSTTCPRTVYTYGTLNKDYSSTLEKSYLLSSGNFSNVMEKQSNTEKIGACYGNNSDTFLVSWQSDTTYGVDNISTDRQQSTAYFTTLRFDAKSPYLVKLLRKVHISHSPLKTDDSITLEFRIDGQVWKEALVNSGNRESGVITGTFASIDSIRFYEIEFRITISGQNELPFFKSLSAEFDMIKSIGTDKTFVR